MRRLVIAYCVAATSVLVACVDSTGPGLPAGAQRMDPPAIYAEWWRMTEACSARTGDFSDITWYVVPGAHSITSGDARQVQGIWIADNSIVIAGESVRSGPLVRHEMLHGIRKQGSHPRGDFVDRCGGIVACEAGCLHEEQAPEPDPTAMVVDPADMEIEASVWPASASASDPEGYLRLTITVRNPGSQSVIVRLPESGDAGPSASFSFEIEALGWLMDFDERAWAPEVTRFAAGQTRQHVFDFWTAGMVWQWPLAAGAYEFRGAYGERWASPASVTVTP